MHRVFVCHASKDKPFVRRLVKALEQQGIRFWVDEREIKVGDSVRRTIESAIDNSDYVVVVISRTSIRRPWVNLEIDAGFELEAKRRRKVILPVLVDDVKVPLFLKTRKYAKFTPNFREGVRALAEVFKDAGALKTHNLLTERCHVLIDLLRIDGSLARYTKTQYHRCLEGDCRSYVESMATDGRLSKFQVRPGRITKRWSEAGSQYVETAFPKILHKGNRLVRTFTCLFHKSFCKSKEHWEQRQNHPTNQFDVEIRFPRGRPPKSANAFVREGADIDPLERLEAISSMGRPALHLRIRNPRLLQNYVIRWSW